MTIAVDLGRKATKQTNKINLLDCLSIFYFCLNTNSQTVAPLAVPPYGKSVFVRISDEYAANILRTALFTIIVRYLFTSCREYPANKVGQTKSDR